MARLSEKELKEAAKQLLEAPTDLCNRVMQKWLIAVLEEMQDRLNTKEPLSASPGCSTAVVEQMREALEMVKSYFWEPIEGDPPVWTEGEVQEFVEAAIKASR